MKEVADEDEKPWFCNHANEVPHTCPCDADCYCRRKGSCVAYKKDTVDPELKRLRKLVEIQSQLLKHFRDFASSMPFCMGDIIELPLPQGEGIPGSATELANNFLLVSRGSISPGVNSCHSDSMLSERHWRSEIQTVLFL